MKNYELVLIFNPSLDQIELEKALAKIKKIITDAGGKVIEVKEWGKRQLAYEIKKQKEGIYTLMTLEMEGLKTRAVDDKIKIEEGVLRHLLVKKE